MQRTSFRMLTFVFCYLLAQATSYPIQGWTMYPQAPRENPDYDYYYNPLMGADDTYGQANPAYLYELSAPQRQQERLAALPVGQETWYESEPAPRWRAPALDDVSATFLDNLILTQMAQDAQRRRENTRAVFPVADYEERSTEDEDVRELKALAGKPLFHEPKTVPRFDDDDYPADDGFINWNGNKRSESAPTPATTVRPQQGDKEVVLPRPADTGSHNHHKQHYKRNTAFINSIAQMLAAKGGSSRGNEPGQAKPRPIEKHFVAAGRDMVLELRGLKHHIST